MSNGYKPFGICDNHTHLLYHEPVETSVKKFDNFMTCYGYERLVLLSVFQMIKEEDLLRPLKALYVKHRLNSLHPERKVYAYGNIYHNYDERDTSAGYLGQIKLMYDLGFDGIKMLEGKPAMRKRLGKRLDDPVFDAFYSFAEENNFPITMHLGDPPHFWDYSKLSDYARKAGWFCDETYPKLEEMQDEVRCILRKHPKLKLTMAHFFFISQDYDEAVRLFEEFPNLSFDLTPGGIMYSNFQSRLDDWREFFVRYSDRIYYGTDICNIASLPDDTAEFISKRPVGYVVDLVRNMLETSEEFEDRTYGRLRPLNLDDGTLSNIYHDNMVNLLGDGREINTSAAAVYAYSLLEAYLGGEFASENDERGNLETMYKYFSELQ